MKNQKLTVNQKFFDFGLRSFQSIFLKCGETDEAWILGLKMLAMPVSSFSEHVMTRQNFGKI